FGEAMLRLTPPDFQRLEQTRVFQVNASGSELNTAFGTARLGLSTAWVSRLVDNPIGRLIANSAREVGVDVSHVQWTGEGRVGLYYCEMGASTRPSRVYYDRQGSAISQIEPGTVDWAGILEGAKVFHVSGITPALSANCRVVTEEALMAAKKAGCLVSFDMNYRARLWSPEEAQRCIDALLHDVDILITTSDDAAIVFGMEGEPVDIARQFVRKYNLKVAALTIREAPSVLRGTWSSVAVTNDGQTHASSTKIDLELIDRVGSGDAYDAGFLYGLLTGDVAKAVSYGDAMSALKHSVPGDNAWVTLAEVQSHVEQPRTKIVR
ncbi:MAG: sugar kinase, partial [Anaerolineae bacterium]